jgi:hypothetical protein
MISFRVASRVAKSGIAVVALPLLAGCNQRIGTPIPIPPAEVTLPPKGTLISFDEVERALAKYQWGPAHDAYCQGCGTAGGVTIRSTGRTKDIKPDNGPANRRIVALIQNYSDRDVSHRPSGTTFKAKTKYLMWVGNRNSKAVWGFIELGPGYNPNPDPIGLLVACKGDHSGGNTWDDANFKKCDTAHALSGGIQSAYASTRRQAPDSASMAAFIAEPGWVSCDPDCCTGTVGF